jgi:hypothetical protein
MITLHTTKGTWPQHIIAGAGPGGKDKAVADFWRGDPQHSAAHIVVDNDGSIVCLADLIKFEAYHATTVNSHSIGIEIYQEANGGIYDAALRSTVELVKVLCDVVGIPMQGSSHVYKNTIIERMRNGGSDVVGIFGHRDNAWSFTQNTSTRGRGDPGDEIFARLRAAGLITFDIEHGAELVYWRKVQQYLNTEHGEHLTIDGICGPSTVAALRRYGLWANGIFVEAPLA